VTQTPIEQWASESTASSPKKWNPSRSCLEY